LFKVKLYFFFPSQSTTWFLSKIFPHQKCLFSLLPHFLTNLFLLIVLSILDTLYNLPSPTYSTLQSPKITKYYFIK
jgi:hypothetical protein